MARNAVFYEEVNILKWTFFLQILVLRLKLKWTVKKRLFSLIWIILHWKLYNFAAGAKNHMYT